jgi:RNA polymerase sigma factor (sigma-70 family)
MENVGRPLVVLRQGLAASTALLLVAMAVHRSGHAVASLAAVGAAGLATILAAMLARRALPPPSPAPAEPLMDPRQELEASPLGASMQRPRREVDRELLPLAMAGEPDAWDALVEGYSHLLWAIARNHGLRAEDAADVSQVVWLRLLEHAPHVDADRLGAWLAATARRECLRVLRTQGKGLGTDRPTQSTTSGSIFSRVDTRQVQAALAQLTTRERQLLALLSEGLSLQEVAAALDMPVGVIGATRRRALESLGNILKSGIAPVADDSPIIHTEPTDELAAHYSAWAMIASRRRD